MQDTKAPLMDKLPTDRPPEIRVLAMPANTNAAGDIFGGWLMSQVDIAGSILAFRHADGRVVTVAVNDFTFIKPVFVGDLVSLYARRLKSGTTSDGGSAHVVYVAVGEDRRPRPIPKP